MPCCMKYGQQRLVAGRKNYIFFLCPLDGEQFTGRGCPPGGPGKEKIRDGAASQPAKTGTQKDSAQKERGKGDLIWETLLLTRSI